MAPSKRCQRRLTSEICHLMKDEIPGICVELDERDITHVAAVLQGPPGTPYEGGFFHFDCKFPDDYPFAPPDVRLMTTDGGRVRFNPNLYANGKVCLSILGTWAGPSWQPSQTLGSVLLSVQSLMSNTPYHNEPGFEVELRDGDVRRYNDRIVHETLRVAVCGLLEAPTFKSTALRSFCEQRFLQQYDFYSRTIEERGPVFDGKVFQDPFNEMSGAFRFGTFPARLDAIGARIRALRPHEPDAPPPLLDDDVADGLHDTDSELEELEL